MADDRPGGPPEHPEDDDRPVAQPSGPSFPTQEPGGYPTTNPPGFELPVPPTEPGTTPLPAPVDPTRRGSMQRQEPGVTTPRPPTVAEARAREKARKRAEQQAQAEADAEVAKKKKRKKVLIGGAAVVGVAGLVGGGYLAYSAITAPEVTAYCTIIAKKGQTVALGNGQTVVATQDNQEFVVADNYCEEGSRSSGGGMGGIFILAGSQYRYYYGGGNNTVGKPPTGGTTVMPKGASVKTKSGTTIQRGGLGTKIGGGS